MVCSDPVRLPISAPTSTLAVRFEELVGTGRVIGAVSVGYMDRAQKGGHWEPKHMRGRQPGFEATAVRAEEMMHRRSGLIRTIHLAVDGGCRCRRPSPQGHFSSAVTISRP